jgi:hypothetical protein
LNRKFHEGLPSKQLGGDDRALSAHLAYVSDEIASQK